MSNISNPSIPPQNKNRDPQDPKPTTSESNFRDLSIHPVYPFIPLPSISKQHIKSRNTPTITLVGIKGAFAPRIPNPESNRKQPKPQP